MENHRTWRKWDVKRYGGHYSLSPLPQDCQVSRPRPQKVPGRSLTCVNLAGVSNAWYPLNMSANPSTLSAENSQRIPSSAEIRIIWIWQKDKRTSCLTMRGALISIWKMSKKSMAYVSEERTMLQDATDGWRKGEWIMGSSGIAIVFRQFNVSRCLCKVLGRWRLIKRILHRYRGESNRRKYGKALTSNEEAESG